MRRTVEPERIRGLFDPQRGLSASEVLVRRSRYGANNILERPPRGWWFLAAQTARDPMLWFLLGTAGLFALLGDWTEALVLLAALLPLAGMDAFLHRRTQASTEGLGSRLASRATVLRDGQRQEVMATELVPGDLALVEGGATFPADGLLLAAEALQIDESTLTGEAFPVRKRTLDHPPGARELLESDYWGLAGTRVLTGQARLRVTHTGGETLYGEIVRSAASGARGRTPLQQAIHSLVVVLLAAAALICLLLAWVRWAQGFGIVDALVSAVTLAVAALPEEFPVVFTFFLGVGVYRLARHQALVRRAVVVENIGRVSTICSDKTGTLTEGRLKLSHLLPADLPQERLLALAAITSRVETGDPLDDAILALAGETAPVAERLALFPFTEQRKRETAVIAEAGQRFAVVKGAPEVVLKMALLDESARQEWLRFVRDYSAAGHKVIACGWRPLPPSPGAEVAEPMEGYTFAGLLAFEDPLREGAAEAVGQCRAAGIHIIMVTGDHPDTARAIAAELGLGGGAPEVIEGDELERVLKGARQWKGDPAKVHVVARATPSQKLLLVRYLQSRDETVAVTGDGVNDVPALQSADIGIAMGGRGTRSAREAAAIVLLDDNFRTIVQAILEGRRLFRNLRLSFAYLLMVHIPLVISAALIPLAGYPLLYLPVHIAWLELIIHPTALLVFQQLPAPERLSPPPRGAARFFDRRTWIVIAVTGLLITVAVSTRYLQALGAGFDVEHARANALAMLITAGAALMAGLGGLSTKTARWMLLATAASLVVLVQLPLIAELLHLRPLHWTDWTLALMVAAGVALPAREVASAFQRKA